MFKKLHTAFLEAIDNFKYELEKDPTSGIPLNLPEDMRLEIENAQELVYSLQREIEQCLDQAQREGDEAYTCKRRKRLALDIGDLQTVRIADEYIVRHERNQKIFEQKTAALREELSMRKDELHLMIERLKGVHEDHFDKKPPDLLTHTNHSGVNLSARESEIIEDRLTETSRDQNI